MASTQRKYVKLMFILHNVLSASAGTVQRNVSARISAIKVQFSARFLRSRRVRIAGVLEVQKKRLHADR